MKHVHPDQIKTYLQTGAANILLPLLVCCAILIPQPVHASHIVINECFARGKGKRPDWIELYNPGSSQVSLAGWSLTDNPETPRKWIIPDSTRIRPHGFCVFFADKKNIGNHTNFKLDPNGEYAGLYDAGGQLVDALTYEKQPHQASTGRFPDGGPGWFMFSDPTLGAPNTRESLVIKTSGKKDLLPIPAPSLFPKGGAYAAPLRITLTADAPAVTLHYTTDGSVPTEDAPIYTAPLEITRTTVLRCRAFSGDKRSGATATQTYFINEATSLPVFSLVTDPANLWDEETGIYVKGTHWKRHGYNKGLYNWKQSWKRPCNVEFFNTSRTCSLNSAARIKISGGRSRNFPQKSFTLSLPGKSDEMFNYAFFPHKDIPASKTLLLRNSGDDWEYTMFRDILMQSLLLHRMDIDMQDARPAVVFLNGTYWGIYNIREKLDKYYIQNNHSCDPDTIDLIKTYTNIKAGNLSAYEAMLRFIRSHDLSDPQNYKKIEQQIDIDEYINYQLAQIFYDNCDWPDNNIAWWREKNPDGRWRWILYDTDEGFQLLGKKKSCSRNTLKVATRPNNRGTFLFTSLLRNEAFKNRFLQIFAAHISTTFQPDRVIRTINALQEKIRPEMPRHIQRWPPIASMQEWENNVDELRQFARQRGAHVYEHLINRFKLKGTVNLQLEVNSPHKGYIRMDTVDIPAGTEAGRYFKDIPMHLHAVPRPGHTFVRWEGMVRDTSPHTRVTPDKDGILRAVFK